MDKVGQFSSRIATLPAQSKSWGRSKVSRTQHWRSTQEIKNDHLRVKKLSTRRQYSIFGW